MIQYIDKATVVEEIKKKLDKHSKLHTFNYEAVKDLESLWYFLNTLEVKEVDLKEKATQLSQKYFPDEENIWAKANIEARKCESACIEMVEWLKTQKGE